MHYPILSALIQFPMPCPHSIAQIAVPVPLSGLFDYLISKDAQSEIHVGARVEVSFGPRTVTGLVMALKESSEYDRSKLKPLNRCLDDSPVLPPDVLDLCDKASRYYHHPIGEVIATGLPNALVQGRPLTAADQTLWTLSEEGRCLDPEALNRAPRQRHLLIFNCFDNLTLDVGPFDILCHQGIANSESQE